MSLTRPKNDNTHHINKATPVEFDSSHRSKETHQCHVAQESSLTSLFQKYLLFMPFSRTINVRGTTEPWGLLWGVSVSVSGTMRKSRISFSPRAEILGGDWSLKAPPERPVRACI